MCLMAQRDPLFCLASKQVVLKKPCFDFQMVDIYDSSRGLVKIGPCKWPGDLDIAFWMSQSDDTILKVKV